MKDPEKAAGLPSEEMLYSEARFRSLVRATAQMVWITDAEGLVNEDSPTWRAFTGQTAEQRLGTGWLEVVHPEDRPRAQAAWQHAVAGRSIYQDEHRLQRPDGGYTSMLVRAAPVFGESGEIIEWIGTHTDIEQQKAAEARLRQQGEVLAAVNRINQALSAELDLERQVQMVTDTATELSGAQIGAFFYNNRDARGESYMLYTLSGVPRERFSRFPMPRNTAIFAHTFAGQGPVRLDDVTRDPRYGHNPPYHGMPQGHMPVRSYLAVPVASRSGEVIGGLFLGHADPGVFTERTERLVIDLATQAAIGVDNARLYREAQEATRSRERALSVAEQERRRLDGIFEQAPVAIGLTRGPQHVIETTNAKYRQLTFHRPVQGKPMREAFPELEGQALLELLDQVYRTGEPFVGNEVLAHFRRDADGPMEEGYFDFIYQPLKDADGSITGIIEPGLRGHGAGPRPAGAGRALPAGAARRCRGPGPQPARQPAGDAPALHRTDRRVSAAPGRGLRPHLDPAAGG